MRRLVIKSIKFFFSILNLIYNYRTHQKVIKVCNGIYSIWIGKQFAKIEEGVHFLGKITLRGTQYIYIKEGTSFGYGSVLTAWDSYGNQKFIPNIVIGKGSHFGEYNHITAINSITIGNGVLTGRWVTITDNSHGKSDYENLCIEPQKRDLYSKGPVTIEDNVWIGDKVSILPGVRIGKSSIIAANSVVTKDVPPFSIAAGIPAKIIKSISSDEVIRNSAGKV